MGSCCSAPQNPEEQESSQLFKSVDVNNDKKACREEIANFVASRPELWAMLSVNLNISEDQCRQTATRVAMEVASGKAGQDALDSELTKQQFHQFRRKYMLNGQGAQEFFHRCVFASFDKDNNNLLDTHELDAFLDTFYQAGSIFEGDARLPPKNKLKQTILQKYSKRDDDMLSFDEIRDIIRGTGGAGGVSTTTTATSKSNSKNTKSPKKEQPATPKKKTENGTTTSNGNGNGNTAARNRRPKKHMDVKPSKEANARASPTKNNGTNGTSSNNNNNNSNNNRTKKTAKAKAQ